MRIDDLLALYLSHHLDGKASASYYSRLFRQIFPPISRYEIDAIPPHELLAWWKALANRPGHANKALGMYRAAHHWGIRMALVSTPDQTRGLAKRPEIPRCQTITPDEWARLVPYLENLKLRHRAYFWALYLLGSRPGEVRMMQVCHVRLNPIERATWTKPTTKTHRPHCVPLPRELATMLRLLMQVNPPETRYVFFGESPARPWSRTSVQKLWESLRMKAGLSHVWLNDLRRSTASDLLNQGENLGVIQAQLNHRSLSQTAKYAYLAVQPLARALERRTADILDHLDPPAVELPESDTLQRKATP